MGTELDGEGVLRTLPPGRVLVGGPSRVHAMPGAARLAFLGYGRSYANGNRGRVERPER